MITAYKTSTLLHLRLQSEVQGRKSNSETEGSTHYGVAESSRVGTIGFSRSVSLGGSGFIVGGLVVRMRLLGLVVDIFGDDGRDASVVSAGGGSNVVVDENDIGALSLSAIVHPHRPSILTWKSLPSWAFWIT